MQAYSTKRIFKLSQQLFRGRTLVIATMHQKEKVLAPLLKAAFGVTSVLCESLNTDKFGTFCGQKQRTESPIETAKAKCLEALSLSGYDLAIASEGSFGPHPSIFFAPADEEILVMIDLKNQLEFVVSELSLATNFNAKTIINIEELMDFAKTSGFPDHGLILRKSADAHEKQLKGIVDETILKSHFKHLKDRYGEAYVETDMRAMHNPSRMAVIEQAAEKLVALLNSECPKCKTPGFAVNEAIPGLPCSLCSLPTRSILVHRYLCQKCNFVEDKKYPNQKEHEDPMYCDFCNP